MRNKVAEHVRALFKAHYELIQHLPQEALRQKLAVRSNAIGEQLWCLVGARESYLRAIRDNGWAGFGCSLSATDMFLRAAILEKLSASALEFDKIYDSVTEWTDVRNDFLLTLLEHEAQHQGQLIRYVYGLKYTFPKSWAERWSLS